VNAVRNDFANRLPTVGADVNYVELINKFYQSQEDIDRSMNVQVFKMSQIDVNVLIEQFDLLQNCTTLLYSLDQQ